MVLLSRLQSQSHNIQAVDESREESADQWRDRINGFDEARLLSLTVAVSDTNVMSLGCRHRNDFLPRC